MMWLIEEFDRFVYWEQPENSKSECWSKSREPTWRDIVYYLSNAFVHSDVFAEARWRKLRVAAQSDQSDYLFIFWLLHCLVNVVQDLSATISCFPHLVFLLWITWRQPDRWTHRRNLFFKKDQACQVAHFSLAHEQIAWTQLTSRLRQMRQN